MKLFIDPGHGGSDSGATGNGYKEKDLTLQFSKLVAEKMRSAGHTVGMSRTTDVYVDLDARGRMMKGYDFGVSFHLNAGGGKGYELIVPAKESYCTIERILASKFDKLGTNTRSMPVYSRDYYSGYKTARTFSGDKFGQVPGYTDYYSINRQAWAVGVSADIVELAFIDNAEDVKNFVSKMDQYATAFVEAIKEAYGEGSGNSHPAPDPNPVEPSRPTLDQVLNPGEYCTLPGIYKVGYVSASRDAFASPDLLIGPPEEYNWIDAQPVTEVNASGQKSGDQVLAVGEYVTIPGRYKVIANDAPTNAVKIKIGRREVWVNATRLLEVE